ncbi:MAG TPA: hypothetical protein VGA27_15815 [Candidatus Binatia bacterium]
MKLSLFILALMVGFYLYWERSEIPRPAGVLAPDEPVQRAAYPVTVREINGYRVAPLASFDIRARVIRSERYHFGSVADLSPVDLVLGWGAMSDSAVLKQISFSQGGRFYHWWTSNFPVPRRVIETHSANMHMIPANGALARQLKSIRAGNMVHLKGWLVEVTTREGFRWTSSLTREDTGGGACELILVESLDAW